METRHLIHGILVLAVVGIAFVSGPVAQPTRAQELATLKMEPIDLSGVKEEKLTFTEYYSLTPLDITPKAAQYSLPLGTGDISNFVDFSARIPLSSDALKLLKENGFVIIESPFNPKEENITRPYKALKDREIPIFITSDSLLHLYHIQFDETLRQIEEREFYQRLWQISKELLDDSIEKYRGATGDLKETARRNVAYFAVALSLLEPREDQLGKDASEREDPGLASAYFKEEELKTYTFTMPASVKEEVKRELGLIEKHEGFSNSPIFLYKEDYSQYVPRGHYTRSEKLKNYFRALMWYGRLSMLLKGSDQIRAGESSNELPSSGALISSYDAKIQTMQACLIASKFAETKRLKENWDRIYAVTSFYVGLADDLGPYEYLNALNSVFHGRFDPNSLTEENVGKLKAKLAEYMPPRIYGGTGKIALLPPFTPEQADEILEATKGFRLMGQRFIPDSYVFSSLVSPFVGMYSGGDCDGAFTCELTLGGPARSFPRGLDAMALLGSHRAKRILRELGDTEYEGTDEKGNRITYETQFTKLKEEFDDFTEADWHKNLYWSWLYALRPLLEEFEDGYPTFMKTEAWQDKELTSCLASWTELRHDTILYAKQSYTPVLGAVPVPEKPVVGYVEPVPEFYNRLLALTKMTSKGLNKMDVLDRAAKNRLISLERILKRLLTLSKKELNNEELTKGDYEFIKDFGEELDAVIEEVDEKAKKTTIIADVHTDSNTGNVLEEAVGYVKLAVVAYKLPDGRILIGAGPVMTYYEFKQPMKDRLTDEKWRELLASNPPEEPEWISSFAE